jgi:hypothetical protein
MANGDPLYHLSEGIKDLRGDIREMRGEMNALRDDLAETRVTVAHMQGSAEGHNEVQVNVTERTHRARSFMVEVAAAAGVILGAVATVATVFHP